MLLAGRWRLEGEQLSARKGARGEHSFRLNSSNRSRFQLFDK